MLTLSDRLNQFFEGSIPNLFNNLEDLNQEYSDTEWELFIVQNKLSKKPKFEFNGPNILRFGLPG